MKYSIAAAGTLLPLALANQVPLNAGDRIQAGKQEVLNKVDSIGQQLKSLSQDTQDIWADVSKYIPHSLDDLSFISRPKPHERRKDWEFEVSGQHVQSLEKDGEKKVDGDYLKNFNLRGRKVDPSKLGVDPDVKQYSGYLDNNEDDKHLFYCEFDYFFCF